MGDILKIIAEGMIVVLSAIGITEIIRCLILFFVRVKTKEDYSYIVLPLGKNCEDAEQRIRAAAARVKWSDSGGAQTIICLDCGMDEETRTVCERIADDYSMVTVVSREEFERASFT